MVQGDAALNGMTAEPCGRGHACTFCERGSTCRLDKKRHDTALPRKRLQHVRATIMVLSNKGGVGKSTVAANIAAALAMSGLAVGLADVDIHGPNAVKMTGAQGGRVRIRDSGIEPYSLALGRDLPVIKLASLAFFLEDDASPVVWRDAYKFDYIQHLFGSFDWGELDYLVLDMPPGTGNELITSCDVLEGHPTFALLVTTPESIALLDTIKSARFCEERKISVLGVIKNMTGMTCPHCEHVVDIYPDHVAESMLAKFPGLEVLVQLPLSVELARSCDQGEIIAATNPGADISTLFHRVAGAIRERVRI